MTNLKSCFVLPFVAFAVLTGTTAIAAGYPEKSIRLVVPFAPGGAADMIARLISAEVTKQAGYTIVVDNRSGANGILGTDIVAKAVPDGYTYLLNSGSIAINPSIYKKLPYNTERDILPVTNVAMGDGQILVVNPSLAAKSVQELIALARKNDGSIRFGIPGIGNSQHLAGELFNLRAGVKLLAVPYKGSAPATIALLSGEVQVLFSGPINVMPYIKTGKMRALGFTGAVRLSTLPDVPTIAESGVPGFNHSGIWNGWFAPAGTPPAIINTIYAAVRNALQAPKVRESLITAGYDPLANTPAEFGKFVRAEIKKYAEIVRDAKIQPQ